MQTEEQILELNFLLSERLVPAILIARALTFFDSRRLGGREK